MLIALSVILTFAQGLFISSSNKNPEPIQEIPLEEIIENDYIPGEGNAITAIRLTPDQALCWTFLPEESVMIFAVGKDKEIVELGEFVIKGSFDNRMEDSELLQYALIEGNEDDILKILKFRSEYNIEMIKSFRCAIIEP